MKKIKNSVFVLLLVAYSGVAISQFTNKSIQSRLQVMDKLLNSSSGAKQVINSNQAESQVLRQNALEFYRKAKLSTDKGDYAESSIYLNQSAKRMFEAIKLATPVKLSGDKNLIDYLNRKKSIDSLQQAFHRIADENKSADSKLKMDRQLNELIQQADLFQTQGSQLKARTEIDKAYHLLKVSIQSLRSGQTLVRTLTFENKHQEYLYELDRNDTHQMLIGLLLEEKVKTAKKKKQLDDFINKSKVLRLKANQTATKKNFKDAIQQLENSTRELVRAIRSAGIYIPG